MALLALLQVPYKLKRKLDCLSSLLLEDTWHITITPETDQIRLRKLNELWLLRSRVHQLCQAPLESLTPLRCLPQAKLEVFWLWIGLMNLQEQVTVYTRSWQ